MKRIKSYKLFESIPTHQSAKAEADDIMSVLNDMVLEIKDKDFSVILKFVHSGNDSNVYYPNIILLIYKERNSDDGLPSSQRYHLREIKDVIVQIDDFMKDQGWQINESKFSDYSGSYNFYIKNGEILGVDKSLEGTSDVWRIDHSILDLKIIFTKSK